jgi:hypothetical protein
MKFRVVSHPGSEIIPADERENNSRQWGEWIQSLNEQSGLPIRNGWTVDSTGVRHYLGDSAGVSKSTLPRSTKQSERVRGSEPAPVSKWMGIRRPPRVAPSLSRSHGAAVIDAE